MIKYIITLALLALASAHEHKRHRVEDPFAALDQHLTYTLANRYFWPWTQLFQAAAAVAEVEESLEEPQIVNDKDVYKVHMNVKRFRPDELSVKVKNWYIFIEGRHKENSNLKQFMANHFMQRVALPKGSKPEEVTAVLKENGVLTVSVPKHDVPPPPPDRIVPIEVRLSESSTAKPDVSSETTTEKIDITSEKITEDVESSSKNPEPLDVEPAKPERPKKHLLSTTATPLEQLEIEKSTTHLGKIRKKELKSAVKTSKDNEVTKGVETNGLDYALMESELE